jgi:hypothetical protein
MNLLFGPQSTFRNHLKWLKFKLGPLHHVPLIVVGVDDFVPGLSQCSGSLHQHGKRRQFFWPVLQGDVGDTFDGLPLCVGVAKREEYRVGARRFLFYGGWLQRKPPSGSRPGFSPIRWNNRSRNIDFQKFSTWLHVTTAAPISV